jgi:hypothetical protein
MQAHQVTDIETVAILSPAGDPAGTGWVEYRASDMLSITPRLVPPGASELREVWFKVVATQPMAFRFQPSAGAGAGYVALVKLGSDADLARLHGKTLTIGALVVSFNNNANVSSAGAMIAVRDKTSDEVRADLVAIITPLATGFGDLLLAASKQPGVIALQSAANASAATISTDAPGNALRAEGFRAAGEGQLDAGQTAAFVLPPGADCRVLALRSRTAGSVVTVHCKWVSRGA